jgi:hypothetical protein
VNRRVTSFGAGIVSMELVPVDITSGQRFLGIFAKSCAEWVIAEQVV